MQLSQEDKRTIGERLRKRGAQRSDILLVAEMCRVTERTVRNWIKASKKEDVPKMGRPRYSENKRFRALLNIARMIRGSNHGITYREAVDSLKHLFPTRLIHESLRKLKAYYRKRKRNLMKKIRKTVTVKASGALWPKTAPIWGVLIQAKPWKLKWQGIQPVSRSNPFL